MKNLIIALLLFPGSVFAQSFKGGVQGGITMSQVDGDRYAGFNKTGIWGELFVEYPFSENASMWHRPKSIFRNQLTCFTANTVGFIFHADKCCF